MMIKWNDYLTEWLRCSYELGKKCPFKTFEEFYKRLFGAARNQEESAQIKTELGWLRAGKPYYHVYPGILKPFLKMDVDKVDCGCLKMPINPLLIQVPANNLYDGGVELRNIVLSECDILSGGIGIYALIEYGKIGLTLQDLAKPKIQPNSLMQCQLVTPFQSGTMLGEFTRDAFSKISIASLNSGVHPLSQKLFDAAIKIIAVCLLLENDPQIISPDVLSADQEKFKLTLDPKYIEKAKRRGKFGWVIGRDIEVSPHIRAPSPFALYWTGKGRTIPIIRYRAGCVVHRELVDKIPTGFDPERENR
jgi:hypothetical protein